VPPKTTSVPHSDERSILPQVSFDSASANGLLSGKIMHETLNEASHGEMEKIE